MFFGTAGKSENDTVVGSDTAESGFEKYSPLDYDRYMALARNAGTVEANRPRDSKGGFVRMANVDLESVPVSALLPAAKPKKRVMMKRKSNAIGKAVIRLALRKTKSRPGQTFLARNPRRCECLAPRL